MNSKHYSIISKVLGTIVILFGICAIIANYANPVSAGISYILFGLLCLIAKWNGDEKN